MIASGARGGLLSFFARFRPSGIISLSLSLSLCLLSMNFGSFMERKGKEKVIYPILVTFPTLTPLDPVNHGLRCLVTLAAVYPFQDCLNQPTHEIIPNISTELLILHD